MEQQSFAYVIELEMIVFSFFPATARFVRKSERFRLILDFSGFPVYRDLTSHRCREHYLFEPIMEARSKWLWTVTIANAVVVCLLIFVVFSILSLATMFGGAIPVS